VQTKNQKEILPFAINSPRVSIVPILEVLANGQVTNVKPTQVNNLNYGMKVTKNVTTS